MKGEWLHKSIKFFFIFFVVLLLPFLSLMLSGLGLADSMQSPDIPKFRLFGLFWIRPTHLDQFLVRQFCPTDFIK